MVIRIDHRLAVTLLAIVAVVGALALGMYLGRWRESAPGQVASVAQVDQQGQQPLAPQQPLQVQPPPAGESATDAGAAREVIPPATLAAEPRIELDAAKELVGQPGTIFVDVRDPDSFAAGHIQGAINVPELEIASRLSELPQDQDLLLYCA